MKTKEFYIDTNILEGRGACIWGRTKFMEVFPGTDKGKKVKFTYENWEKARKGRLNLGWLAEKVLSYEKFLTTESHYNGQIYNLNGSFTKRYGDLLYNAIKEKLGAK